MASETFTLRWLPSVVNAGYILLQVTNRNWERDTQSVKFSLKYCSSLAEGLAS
jgi:hypothetical protein